MVVRSGIEQRVHAQIAAGDVAGAAEQLVLLYGSAVLGRCRTLVRDRAVAEDLAQDAFCRAFSGLAAFRGEASLRTWLFTIVRNVCIDHHRRTAGTAWLRDADAEEQPEERPFLIELMVDREQLERALARMREALGPRWAREPIRGAVRGPARSASRGARIVDKISRTDRAARGEIERTSAFESPPLVASAEDRLSGRDALAPLAQALGELLERGEARPPVEGLLRALEQDLVGLQRDAGGPVPPSEPAAPKSRFDPKRWLGWLFGRPPRA